MYYKMLISWTSQKVKETYTTRNAFDFKNVCDFDRSLLNAPGPCVLFATPGMISGGFSLEVFKQWAPSKMNLITLPGYCVAGTVGHKLMSGKATKIDLDKDTQIDVRCQIHQLSFSPHTDSKGIMDLLKFLSPKHVILVHGEKPKMVTLKGKIQSELGIPCYHPANNETVSIPSTFYVKAEASNTFIQCTLNPNFKFSKTHLADQYDLHCEDTRTISKLQVSDERVTDGIMLIEKNKKTKVVHQDDFLPMLGEVQHEVRFAYCCPIPICSVSDGNSQIHQLFEMLSCELSGENVHDCGEHIQVESFRISICLKENNCPYRNSNNTKCGSEFTYFCCSWSVPDEVIAWKIISFMENVDSSSV